MAIMSVQKKSFKSNNLKAQIAKEVTFLKNVFSTLSIPTRMSDDTDDVLLDNSHKATEPDNGEVPKRARSITELEERLEKIKSQNNFNLKNKLMKKSLSSKLNKKLKKQERLKKTNKPIREKKPPKPEVDEKPSPHVAKPVFNNEGKLVFSKFDFANTGRKEKAPKVEKDPRKILENLGKQEEKLRQISEQDNDKAKEIKEKMSWKNVLQKAEGQKIKDDKILLKKSIKKMDQKKKHSKKQWEARIEGVAQKKEDRQKKRKENISMKKKEKKGKVVKAAAKRGRVII